MSAGHVADEVGTTRELIATLAERVYDFICLDIVLSNDITIEETRELVRTYFPKISIRLHDDILEDLGVSQRATVSGLYLLPVVKAIAPRTKVIMLTAAWDGPQVEQHLRKWGSEVTVSNAERTAILDPETLYLDWMRSCGTLLKVWLKTSTLNALQSGTVDRIETIGPSGFFRSRSRSTPHTLGHLA